MSGKDSFVGINPFLQLKGKNFPWREIPSDVPEEDTPPDEKQAHEAAPDEDARLFLQSVRALSLKKLPSWITCSFSEEAFSMSDILAAEAGKAAARRELMKPPVKSIPPATRPARTCEAREAEEPDAEEQSPDFIKAMCDVQPLQSGKGRDLPREIEPPAVLEPHRQSFRELLENTPEFSLNFSEEYLEGHVVGLDSLILQKLRAGQYSPEAHLDLHGFNARQAFDALVGFVRRSWHRGMRTLLLIPGRGKNSPDGVAVLRERVQAWLTQDPLKRVVLAFCTARPVDGGAGSLYVLLRKYKQKGKVLWERCSADLDL
jgi:DNA-nicking Smr family endonuclease